MQDLIPGPQDHALSRRQSQGQLMPGEKHSDTRTHGLGVLAQTSHSGYPCPTSPGSGASLSWGLGCVRDLGVRPPYFNSLQH
ncbi:hypothetical protein VULLAG_LOCUS21278 [Vulpes lagopus]